LRDRQLLSPTIQEASINAGLLGDLGLISAATHASFSERDHRRRLSTDVMTSIRFMAL
jgi:hypothetical protein